PSPTRNSPHGTRKLNNSTFGIAKPSRNAAHHPCTAGCSPTAFSTAPCKNPVASNPPTIFSQPATNHAYPRYSLITNSTKLATVLSLKKRSMVDQPPIFEL